MIYFIRCGEFVKIGRARDPLERLASLQTSNPYTVSLIGTIDVPDDEEARLHSAFAMFRHKGEWFFLSKTISDFIDSHCEKQDEPKRVRPKKEANSNVIIFAEKKDRNREVLRMHSVGKSDREIAFALGISERTVRRIKLQNVLNSSSSRDSVT